MQSAPLAKAAKRRYPARKRTRTQTIYEEKWVQEVQEAASKGVNMRDVLLPEAVFKAKYASVAKAHKVGGGGDADEDEDADSDTDAEDMDSILRNKNKPPSATAVAAVSKYDGYDTDELLAEESDGVGEEETEWSGEEDPESEEYLEDTESDADDGKRAAKRGEAAKDMLATLFGRTPHTCDTLLDHVERMVVYAREHYSGKALRLHLEDADAKLAEMRLCISELMLLCKSGVGIPSSKRAPLQAMAKFRGTAASMAPSADVVAVRSLENAILFTKTDDFDGHMSEAILTLLLQSQRARRSLRDAKDPTKAGLLRDLAARKMAAAKSMAVKYNALQKKLRELKAAGKPVHLEVNDDRFAEHVSDIEFSDSD